MIYEFPQGRFTYTRSPAFITWIKDDFHGGQEDKGAWMTIEARSFPEAVNKFNWAVAYGRKIGAYL